MRSNGNNATLVIVFIIIPPLLSLHVFTHTTIHNYELGDLADDVVLSPGSTKQKTPLNHI
ncbi:hypothetical protein FF38_14406 [Lucilia cuprina]|uniref:Uncharacterized protein n=1 Tax=Lucilia cuprina TaxID=7375 RepID=A0A0L0CGG9_LUCCU|nr:hypothetical protein FF38_14406 [Lucilia cuprina]